MSTDMAPIVVGALAILVVGYQLYVTSLVWRSDQISTSQKWLQTVLIWVLVVVGAVFSHAVLRWNAKPLHRNPFPQPNEHTGGSNTTGAPPTVD
jgi:hypothetical protein